MLSARTFAGRLAAIAAALVVIVVVANPASASNGGVYQNWTEAILT